MILIYVIFHLQRFFDKSISNLTAGLFKSLLYVVLNLLMFHLMTMEQVNLSVYAPLEFLLFSEFLLQAQKEGGIKSRLT